MTLVKIKEIIDSIPNNKSFSSIIDFIIKNYHSPSRIKLIELEKKIDFLEQKFWEKYEELKEVKILFSQYYNSYINHINKEEDFLFKKIKELEEKINNNEEVLEKELISIEIDLKKQNIEHEEFEIYWANFLWLLLNSKIKNENIKEYEELVKQLEDFRIESMIHSKIESYYLDILVLDAIYKIKK